MTQELSIARQELQRLSGQKEKEKKAPFGVELIDNSLKIITEMQQGKRVLEKENNDLKNRLES